MISWDTWSLRHQLASFALQYPNFAVICPRLGRGLPWNDKTTRVLTPSHKTKEVKEKLEKRRKKARTSITVFPHKVSKLFPNTTVDRFTRLTNLSCVTPLQQPLQIALQMLNSNVSSRIALKIVSHSAERVCKRVHTQCEIAGKGSTNVNTHAKTHPEFVGRPRRARWVVLGVEIGCRFVAQDPIVPDLLCTREGLRKGSVATQVESSFELTGVGGADGHCH